MTERIPQPPDEPPQRPTHEELVEWLIRTNPELVVTAWDNENQARLQIYKQWMLKTKDLAVWLSNDKAYMQKHFPDSVILEMMEADAICRKERQKGI